MLTFPRNYGTILLNFALGGTTDEIITVFSHRVPAHERIGVR